MKFVHKFYSVILFLNLSETYRVVSYFINLPTVAISTGSLIINLVYIFLNINSLKILLKKKIFILWLIISPILPFVFMCVFLFTGFLSLSDMQYWVVYDLLFSTLFISSCILAYNVKFSFVKAVVWLAVISTIIGFILNNVYFELFRKMGELGNVDQSYVKYSNELTRGISFFTMPNRAAFASICFFIILFTTGKIPKIKIYYFLGSIILFIMVIITGSRTSLLLLIFVLSFYLLPNLIKAYRINFNSFAVLLFSGFIILIIFLLVVPDLLSYSGYSYIADRIDLFKFLASNTETLQDKSLNARLDILSVYWKYIKESPILGHGPQFGKNLLKNGTFANVSQNTFIDALLTYGFFYCSLYIYTLYKTYIYLKNSVFKGYIFNPVKIFAIFYAILCFSISNMYWQRPISITLGIVLGYAIQLYYTSYEVEKENLRKNS